MTRRGSLAYYLAAWTCGCFFMSALVWLRDSAGTPGAGTSNLAPPLESAMGLLFVCFYGLIFGAFASLIGAFLLRRIAAAFHWWQVWQWTLAGAVLTPVIIGLVGAWWRRVGSPPQGASSWLSLLGLGPAVVLDAGLWLAIPVGAATAILLFRIHRAFAPQPESAPGESYNG